MLFLYAPRGFRPAPVNLKLCRASISQGARSMDFRQCSRAPTVERVVKGAKVKLCTQHDPEVMDARKATRAAKWEEQGKARHKHYDMGQLEQKISAALLKATSTDKRMKLPPNIQRLLDRYRKLKEQA